MTVPLIALVAATLFAGAALYITLVEHPARLRLDDASMLAQWQPSYKAALPIQAGLAVLGGMLGIIVWYQTRDWRWIAGSLVLLANWPFTLIGIMPTTKRLMAMTTADAGAESRQLLRRWGGLHSIRSAWDPFGGALLVEPAGALARICLHPWRTSFLARFARDGPGALHPKPSFVGRPALAG